MVTPETALLGDLKASLLDTKLGPMIAVADDESLYILEFIDRHHLDSKIENLRQKTNLAITAGCTQPISSIERELKYYFEGSLKEFKTSLCFLGSHFQKQVWEELKKIPFGQMRSYLDIAISIGKPTAFRAVAQANGANKLAIAIPCHRVINTSGALGGYSAGLTRKQWLLKHEQK